SIGAPTVPDNEPLSVTINAVPLASFGTIRLNGQTIAANTTLTVAQLQQLQFVPAHTGDSGSLTYTVSDASGGSTTTTVTLEQRSTTPPSATLGFDPLPLSPDGSESIPDGYGATGNFAGFTWANMGIVSAPDFPNPFSGSNTAYGDINPSTISTVSGAEFTVNSIELGRLTD